MCGPRRAERTWRGCPTTSNTPRWPIGEDHHLRPIRTDDVDLDLAAVRGSRDRLWATFGRAWNWPPDDLTREGDLAELAWHEGEMAARSSYDYALFDTAETVLLGCVYIDPPEKVGADADVSWWVVDELVGGDVERRLVDLVPRWIVDDWPFSHPRFIGRDLTWDDWLALPDHPDA